MSNFNKKGEFDERQLWIRGNIFKHMFLIAAFLLLSNACLVKLDIIWADGFYSNLIILFAAVAVGSIEMIFREVYFQTPGQQWIIGIIGLSPVLLFVMNIIHLISGEKFISNGALTEAGGSLIYSVLLLSISIGWIIKQLRDKFRIRKSNAD